MAELSACKIWATMLKSGNSFSSLAQEEQELIQFQMSAYYDQSQYNANGWSIIQYEKQPNVIENNIYRSAYPAVQDSANYWQIMNSVLNDSLHNIAVAHLRAATSELVQFKILTPGFLKVIASIRSFIMEVLPKMFFIT